jgi:ABC-type protease/lipase transport system fused ATPase/permease subunit
VHGVGFRQAGASAPVLAGVSFELEPGDALGVIGPTGAGKSTLARLLVGLWEPTMGSIRLDGVEVSTWPRAEFGPYVGYLPQDVELLSGTVAANIARFGELDSDRIVSAARSAGTHDLIVHLPEGYETAIGEGGRALSGGQRQRIALARALYGDARFIVLDEPNANLDMDGEMALRRALVLLKEAGRTVILISHRPSLLGSVDKLLVLREGRVDMFGPRDQVLAQLKHPVSVVPRPGEKRLTPQTAVQ